MLGCTIPTFSQSTTVSGTITDAGAQPWFGGTFSFVFKVSPSNPTGPYFWNGAPFNPATTITGPLDASAHYSVSIPSSTSITPAGSTWTVTFCPLATAPCFIQNNTSVTGGSQTVAPTPTAISIGLISPPGGPVRAYSDSEISSAAIASIYYNLVSIGYRNCTAVSGQTCTTWQAISGGGGGGISWFTVATLPASPAVNTTAGVLDGNGASCTVGGGSTQVICRWDGAVWQVVASNTGSPASPNGSIQKNAAGIFGASNVTETSGNVLVVNDDTESCIANPYNDIRCYGAVAVNTGSVPFIPGITANCNGTTTVTLSAASSFVNGQGVAIQGCGATNTMSTPSAPVVTSAIAAAPTGSGYTVAGAAGGSETTCYKLVAIDKGQGLTAASSETCVTGQTRGQISTALTSCLRSSNTLVTCTSSAHTLAVGAWVNVHGTNLDAEYGGWHILTAVPDSTHFSYQWSRDSRAGASTVASSGGVVDYRQGNHIVIAGQAPPAGVWQYVIYRGASGAETYADVSMIVTSGVNLDSSYMTWDDFGTTYTAASNRPWYIPNTPPGSATNDTLVTVINSGAGTTTLTLRDAATQTASGLTIVTDNTPNYISAFTAALSNHGMVYAPQVSSGSFGTNTILDLTSYSGVGLSLSSSAYFGATLVTTTSTVQGNLPPASLTSTQFSIEGLTNITFNAKPGVYTRGGVWRGIAFNPSGNNTQGVFVAAGGIPTGLFQDDAFLGASNGGDWSSIPLILFAQGQAGSAAAGIKFENIFTKGTSQGATPLILSKNYSELTFKGMMGGGKGVAFLNCPTCTIASVNFDQQFETQSLSMPMYTTRGTVALTATGLEDTGAQPLVSHTGQGPLTVCFSGSVPSSSIPQVTGTNITSFTCSSATDIQRGVNVNYTSIVAPSFMYDGTYNTTQPLIKDNMPHQIGPNYALFTTPSGSYAAPTCNVVSAGPPFSMSAFGSNTYTFAYTPVYPNGGQGIPSPTVSCAMDGATQQATITIPAQVTGATGYFLLFGTGGGLGNYYTVQQGLSLSILVPACTSFCQGQSAPTLNGSGPAGLQNNNMWSGTFNLGQYMDITGTTGLANPSAGQFRVSASTTTNKLICRDSVGGNCGIPPELTNSYVANHTLLDSESAVLANATLTFTLPHALINFGWDIFSLVGTTTLSIDSGTLFGNGASGSFVIPTNQGVHAWCDGTNCYAYGLGGAGGGGTPGGATNAFQYNAGGGAFAGVNSPIINGNYNIHYRVTASASVAPSIDNPGIPINAQTGTTYTIGTANTDFDRGYAILANNSGAQTYTAVNPSTTGYGFNHYYLIRNIGTGTVTENASGFTINGGASLLIPPSWTAWHWSDGVNYFSGRFADFTAFPNCTGGGNALQFTTSTGVFSCGSASAGVSSWSGDGALYNNSLSTGAVTATLANAGAHKYWGNNTGVSATPAYVSLVDADLPADTVLRNQANTYSGGGLQDLSAMTWKIPTSGGATASATNMIAYDSTNKNPHIYANNTDAIALGIASAPTTGHLLDTVVSSGNVLAHDSGITTANVCAPNAFAAQTDAATVTWAIASAMCANASLTFTVHSGSRTLNITNPVNGGSYVIWLKQDATGGEGLTLGTGCTWKVSGGGAGAITPSTAANAIDVLAFTYDGTNCYANFNKNFN